MKRFSLLFLMLLMLAAPGCHRGEGESTTPSETTEAGASDPRLSAYHWHLVDATSASGERLDALFPNPERPVTLDFAEGRVSVSNACNRMGGTFALDGTAFTVGDLMQTEMACEAPLMRAETAIAGVLAGGGTIQVERDALVLTTTAVGRCAVPAAAAARSAAPRRAAAPAARRAMRPASRRHASARSAGAPESGSAAAAPSRGRRSARSSCRRRRT